MDGTTEIAPGMDEVGYAQAGDATIQLTAAMMTAHRQMALSERWLWRGRAQPVTDDWDAKG